MLLALAMVASLCLSGWHRRREICGRSGITVHHSSGPVHIRWEGERLRAGLFAAAGTHQ